eukprot:gnl/TRDRNA2_/TRDRNA2_93205_c0_seq1.p1 gnl/TRDRNA2_/TRDRNA2_93205_c0~~gnl/TRDRNA2_/TRDRNA2_93205_c0_seq1.p1  ORF type:complete len:479 (-),score=104.92 gnl/TRDRNA2_/TRDRNA2_93205_c0_seq1:74-1444(-)
MDGLVGQSSGEEEAPTSSVKVVKRTAVAARLKAAEDSQLGSSSLAGDSPEEQRVAVRNALIAACGSPAEAFKALDLNGSKRLSLQEFVDGMHSYGVNWQEITGMKSDGKIFKLFDQDKDGVLTFFELFPEERHRERAPKRCSTPEFWGFWCKNNEEKQYSNIRRPQWEAAGAEEELKILMGNVHKNEHSAEDRKRMRAMFRRLKSRGKSDAKCREIVAQHLPRGTGPRDRQDVHTFTIAEVKICKRAYHDQLNEPVKRTQKVLYDIRDQRRELHDARTRLYTCMEPALRAKQEEERKAAAAESLMGLAGLGGNRTVTKKDLGAEEVEDKGPERPPPLSFQEIVTLYNMPMEQVESLWRAFMTVAGQSEGIGYEQFAQLVQTLCPGRTFGNSDLHHWWNHAAVLVEQIRLPSGQTQERRRSVTSLDASEDHAQKYGIKICEFESFIGWYHSSEVRMV